jgi:signal transduction histidine kinase
MLARGRQVLALSLFISLLTAVLVYASLQWLMVRPLHRITRSLMAFREAPDDPGRVIAPSGRGDELGVLEQELARMQTELLAALAQRSRLAALGKAVSKINHDFKSILSTVSIASERLARVDDPTVRRIAPLLVDSVERAVNLCTQTQDLARGDQAVPQRVRFKLRNLLEEVAQALKPEGATRVQWTIQVPASLEISADRERLYRVFSNLGRNAIEVLGGQGEIRVSASAAGEGVSIEFADTGSGVPESVRAHLFEPFIGSARPGGMGLGLATARDLVRAHGGDLSLLTTGSEGTCFRIDLPNSLGDARQSG